MLMSFVMKLLPALLLLAAAAARAGIVPAFEPADLEKADTIVLIDASQKTESMNTGFSDQESWRIQGAIALKGSAPADFTLDASYQEVFTPPTATSYLVFLRGTGAAVQPISQVGCMVGLTGDFNAVGAALKTVPPDAWSLIAACLERERDPACALHQSKILSGAPPAILNAVWSAVQSDDNTEAGLRLACQNIGMRVAGVSALRGFVEPDFRDSPPTDPTGERMAMAELLPTMAMYFYRSADLEDYHHILDWVRTQRGDIGAAALVGIDRRTQRSDLPELLDIFEHSPSREIRYQCIHNFYYVLGQPQPSGIPGIAEFERHPQKYMRLWETRVAAATGK
jgi:hypothetical protein